MNLRHKTLLYQSYKWTCYLPDSQTSKKPHQAFTEVTLNALKARPIHESILIIQKSDKFFSTAKQLKVCLLSFRWDICPQTEHGNMRICSGAESNQYVLGQTADLHPSEETLPKVFPVKTTEKCKHEFNAFLKNESTFVERKKIILT